MHSALARQALTSSSVVLMAIGAAGAALLLMLAGVIGLGTVFGRAVPEQQLQGTLPAQWPAGFPVYPAATAQLLSVVAPGNPGESDIVEFGVDADPGAVLGWYRAHLGTAGWKLERAVCCGVPNVAFSSRSRLLTGEITAWSNSQNVRPSSIVGATTVEVQFHHSVATDWNDRTNMLWAAGVPLVGLAVGFVVRWLRVRRRRIGH